MRSLSLPLQSAPAKETVFLGVERSVRGLRWVERLPLTRMPLAMAIAQRHGLPEIMGRILAARDADLDAVPTYLNPTIKTLLPDPLTLRDMDGAIDRIAHAIERGEQIAIFGDYDVDGAASSALLCRFLAHHGLSPRIYIPDRMTEGYGPNADAMEELVGAGASLIVTVDCGSTSFEALSVATSRGADVVVVDHHQVGAELPQVRALVNPNRQDCVSGQGHLCAAGVVFLLCAGLTRELRKRGHYKAGREPELLSLLDIVALATICDVVPLHGVNRAFVVQGLKVMAQRRNPGIKALCDAAGVNKRPTAYTLGFVLGPRINAGGRIGDSSLGAKLLTTENEHEAAQIAQTLDRLNRERREIELKTVEEATAWADKALMEDPSSPIIIAGSPAWHKGLVGLVASRITERCQRPSLIFSHNPAQNEAVGSARSVAGVDIGAAVRGAVERGLAKKGGGHAMAAGVTVAEDKLGELAGYLRETLKQSYQLATSAASLAIDGALRPQAATSEFVTQFEMAGPFGQGNPAPRFCVANVRVGMLKELAGGHLRMTLQASDGAQLTAVAFRAAKSPLGDALARARDMPFHAAGRIEKDEWGGRERVEFQVEDLAIAK